MGVAQEKEAVIRVNQKVDGVKEGVNKIMAGHTCKTKTSAQKYATRMRKKGYKASVYPKKGKGWGVSITR